MRIEYVERGFEQHFDNKVIEKIVYIGDYINVGTDTFRNNTGELMTVDKQKFVGVCTIHFYHKPPKELRNVNFDSGYNSQYGIPISEDGSKLFVGHWEKTLDGSKRGLEAYDTESGALLWRLHEGKIREIFVYSTYLIALQAGGAVFKAGIDSGEVLGQIKSGTIEQQFELDSPYTLVNAIKGKLSVLDTEKMAVLKTYSPKTVNPSNCLSALIQNVSLQDDVLTISGIEEYPDGDFSMPEGRAFSRVIDSSFSAF